MPADRRIEFRIGIHIGDIIVEEDDIFGDGVQQGIDDKMRAVVRRAIELGALRRRSEVVMIAVIFEVLPAKGRKDEYLERAARLKTQLECMDGFISVERFQSLTDPDKLLSLSLWRDEEAIAGWRSRAGHRAAQSAGRKGIFRDYRLLVASVLRDYSMSERREQVPADSRAIHDVRV